MPKTKKEAAEAVKEKKKPPFSRITTEFRVFIARGNIIDLAVGVIIGASFTAIVNSAVKDVISPLIGIVIGGVDLSALTVVLPSLSHTAEPPVLRYGAFLQAVLNFFITAAGVFFIVKGINAFQKNIELAAVKVNLELYKVEKPKAADVVVLEEIRDLLKANAESDSRK